MSAIGANRWMQVGSTALLLLVMLLLFRGCGREHRTTEEALRVAGGAPVSRGLAVDLGVEGDTEADTVKTLVAEVKNLRDEADALRDSNVALRKDNAELRKMESRLGRGLNTELNNTRREVQAQLDDDVQRVRQQLRELEEHARDVEGRLASGGLSAGGFAGSGTGAAVAPDAITWVAPLGSGIGGAGNSLSDHLNRVTGRSGQGLGLPTPASGAAAEEAPVPWYTVPRNATLMNATAMTALVGRVPIGAQVTDPYSFKVIIGTDNLAANGIEVPEVAYAIASGKAVGDWTLGCVRGDLHSITFVFEDGTIRTVPKAENVYEGNTQQQNIVIGELSDEYGNPCVVGQRISNASTYLAQRIGVVSAAAAAEAAAASQTTQITTFDGGGAGVGTIVTGDMGEYILGQAIADGSLEIARWLDERQAQQFDAIYVDPGARVSLHITEQLEIDYDPNGRRTNHLSARQGDYRALD
ncbi:MAG: TIGR03752 family integrating conjugative element protein [Haliea sp.]|uniref:TIGR03752 family integrating conjugative element protein n=1 Tax=Haliea TaxID=475794 RepID=UPI000C62A235|nr:MULTISPECIES: TIGR03752 family integrating conjugative element protein [Haliea]MAA80710.1 TIGR03752 family integrating conjugative element protein [Hyphomonas sp.]MBM68132.1 TIGR03752 family integrating conjugative element protein [Haliea sp.]|tara:strand:+ start:23433 stop:24842 length:1410 start_codon:yes stop_codon:yes gene_type:complete